LNRRSFPAGPTHGKLQASVLLLFPPAVSVPAAVRSITVLPEIDPENYLKAWTPRVKLIWGEGSAADAIADANVQQTLCTTILNNFEQLFGRQPLMSYGSAGTMSINKLIDERKRHVPSRSDEPVSVQPLINNHKIF
jgi:hypothetical protein